MERASGARILHFSAFFTNHTLHTNIDFPFELVHLKVDILLSIYVFHIRQVYTEFHAQVHRPRRQKAHPV